MVHKEYCDCCAREKPTEDWWLRPGWFTLQNYNGLWGLFCDQCYQLVKHVDSKPINPEAFAHILMKQAFDKAAGKGGLTPPSTIDLVLK